MPVDIRQSLHFKVLVATLVMIALDLSARRGGAQAWTYNYSTGPNQRWREARQWCKDHFTDMVAIQNQEEGDFLNNLLPFNSRYYWIGVKKENGTWTWVESNQTVPEEAQNWAKGEPDQLNNQDCVEIYIKREKDTAKWNNDKCRYKKGTVCYSASCKQEYCSSHADCVETIGNYTCKCHPGFQGPRCEDAAQCPVLEHTSFSGGSVNCSHPITPFSYNSTCEFRCDEGYELIGQDQIICDHTGQWTASAPVCTVKKCPPIFFTGMGNMTCVDAVEPFSFGSRCNFTCQEGYYLTGDKELICLASGQWSKPTPTCTVVQCNRLQAPPSAYMQCQDPIKAYSYSSTCTMQCEEGFDLIGTNVTKCTSQGSWSPALPVCQAKRCNPISSPPHGSISCSGPNGSFSFRSRCSTTCEEGFVLNGTADTECTSQSTWSTDIPHCLAKKCPSLNSTAHSSLVCSEPHGQFSFGSRCNTTCEEGFVLNGTADTECTSQSTWSTDIPQCLVRQCPLLAKAPHYGRMNCSHLNSPFSYGSHCDFECSKGFWLKGTSTMTCNSSGHWGQDLPTCQPVQCKAIHVVSSSMSMNCSHPLGNFSFGSQCLFTCKDGFTLNGIGVLLCSATGTWNDNLPSCTGMSVGNAMLLYTGAGAGFAIVILALIGLVMMIMTRFKKRGNKIMSDAPEWGDRENPAFEF